MNEEMNEDMHAFVSFAFFCCSWSHSFLPSFLPFFLSFINHPHSLVSPSLLSTLPNNQPHHFPNPSHSRLLPEKKLDSIDMRSLSYVAVAVYAVLAVSSLSSQADAIDPWHPPQLPFSWGRARDRARPAPSQTSFVPKKETFRLQHILAHGAPGAKTAKIFRKLEVDDQMRMEMASINLLDSSSSSPGSSFEHSIADAFFPDTEDDHDDMPDPESADGARGRRLERTTANNFPFPGRRVPNAEDYGTVVSMVRMALDCYVDPARQGWVDIGDDWEVDSEIGWLEAGLRGYIFASEDQKTVVIGIKGTSLKLFGTGGGPTGNNDKLNDNKMFSCCCGKVDRTWWSVCGCYMGGNQCDQQCLVDDLIKDRDEEESYVGIGLVRPSLIAHFLVIFHNSLHHGAESDTNDFASCGLLLESGRCRQKAVPSRYNLAYWTLSWWKRRFDDRHYTWIPSLYVPITR